MMSLSNCLLVTASLFVGLVPTGSDPVTSRLTPPSALFSAGDPDAPIVSRFLPGQRFDLQATVQPDPGQTIQGVAFFVDGAPVPGVVTLTPATAAGLPANTVVATLRAYSKNQIGVHLLEAVATQDDFTTATAQGNFEVVKIKNLGPKVKNVIFCIGDGMGIAHRTAARLMLHGASQGKAQGFLAMDSFPGTGMVMTHSLDSIVTDSSPGAACYSTGNKFNNNQQGVFPDDTLAAFDNPRVELIGEYLQRTKGKSLGIVTTSDVFDATPGAFGSHTQSRALGTGICDQYFDDRGLTGLTVLLGGGRKWFLPAGTTGSARSASSDYVLPADLAAAWAAAPGAIDPARDLLADFQAAGFTYASTCAEMQAVPGNPSKLLGLFSLSNMNVAHDKIGKRRGTSTVVDDYGFPDQPMLDEMAQSALQVLQQDPDGFVLMIEAASIDKQAHNMDTERWILDTIEFDRAVAVCKAFAEEDGKTLVIVTADHECAGVNIIGGSLVSNADLIVRSTSGLGTAPGGSRNGVVGTYTGAGFPHYEIAADGYPETTDIDRRMLIGYAANGDRHEDWLTNALPLRDSQQPFNNLPPLNTYPTGPIDQDTAGAFLVTGQIQDTVAAHTASDIPVSALGPGEATFTGVMDNTDVFFRVMQAVLGGTHPVSGNVPR